MKRFALILAILSCTGLASAQDLPRDPRLPIVPYVEGQIIELEGHLGYQMMIEFDPQERIENVSIGDSLAWQVTPNRAATLLFLKPVVAHAATNMTVVTTRRRYAFALRALDAVSPDDPRVIYGLRFSYPTEANAGEPSPTSLNFDYAMSGDAALMPVEIFDDGHSTYLRMREGAETPAIFALRDDDSEELVNSQQRGSMTVVDQTADRFVLRYGSQTAFVTRTGVAITPPERARRSGRR